MGSVRFNPADGVPRMTRATSVPTHDASTIVAFVKVTAYEDFMSLLGYRHANGDATEIWSDATGVIRGELFFGGPVTMFSGSPTDWLKVAITTEVSGGDRILRTYYQTWDGTFTTGGTDTVNVTSAFSEIYVAAHPDFLSSMEGDFRFAGIKIWNDTLSSAEVEAEFAQRTPVITTNCVFANECTGAATVNVDASPVAENMTVTGTPTDETDDPWQAFEPGDGLVIGGEESFIGEDMVGADDSNGVTGTGGAAMSPNAASGSGTETFSGSGSAAMASAAAAGSGAETFSGTASSAMASFGVAADGGVFANVGGGGAAAAPFAAIASGTETFTATAAAAMSAFAAAAAALETFSAAAAAAAAAAFAASGAGAQTYSGTGSAAAASFSALAAAIQTFTGTATSAMASFAITGAGTVANPITGTGAAALPSFGADGVGGSADNITGTGSAALSSFSASGAGGQQLLGAATSAMASFAVTGAAAEQFLAEAAAALAAFAAMAAAVETLIGTGAAAMQPFGAIGVESPPPPSPRAPVGAGPTGSGPRLGNHTSGSIFVNKTIRIARSNRTKVS